MSHQHSFTALFEVLSGQGTFVHMCDYNLHLQRCIIMIELPFSTCALIDITLTRKCRHRLIYNNPLQICDGGHKHNETQLCRVPLDEGSFFSPESGGIGVAITDNCLRVYGCSYLRISMQHTQASQTRLSTFL